MATQETHPIILDLKSKGIYNEPFTMLVTFKVQPDKTDIFAEEARKTALASNQEKGSKGYTTHRSVDDPTTFVFVERWTDGPGFEFHLATEHNQRFGKVMQENLSEQPDVKILQAL